MPFHALRSLVVVTVLLWGIGCNGGGDGQATPVALEVSAVEVVTASPQAGHPIDVRATIFAEADTEDVSVTFFLRPVSGNGDNYVLDSCVEDLVPATVALESDPETEVGHELIARMTVPPGVPAGTYFVYASLSVLPTSTVTEAELKSFDGEAHDLRVTIGDDLRNTPDLVIADAQSDTKVIVLMDGPERDPLDFASSHWTGTVRVASYGGTPVEDVAISALLEVPGHPLQPLKIWNGHRTVQIWRNNGSATFKDTLQRLGGQMANAVALGDLDGDGDLDLVAGYGHPDGDPVPDRVWLNDDTGTFIDTNQELGQTFTRAVALADLDGDGDLDLVTGTADDKGGQEDQVWINQGLGLFAAPKPLGTADTYALAVADVDGDGDTDIVTAGSANRVWLNDGKATFTDSGQDLGAGPIRALALADVDGNGLPDLVLGGASSALWLNQNGVFTRTTQEFGDVCALALGDLDRDQDADLLVGLVAGGVQAWRNANGVFAASGPPLGADRHAFALAIGDLNGDGFADLAAGNDDGDGTTEEPDAVWLNAGLVQGIGEPDPVFHFVAGQLLGGSDTRSIALGDIDSDGDLDLVSGNLGLPDRIEGKYEDALVLPILRPGSPMHVPLTLYIPPEVRAKMTAGSVISTSITFSLDRFDDIPEYESSFVEPGRSNDNVITFPVTVIPPPPAGKEFNKVTVVQDNDLPLTAEKMGLRVTGHAESSQDKEGSRQVLEKSIPLTVLGWTVDVAKLRGEGREYVDRPEDARYTQDLEFAGQTIYTMTKLGSQSATSQGGAVNETQDVTTEVTFSVCWPPTAVALEEQTENIGSQVKRQKKHEDDDDDETTDFGGGILYSYRIGPLKAVLTAGICGKLGVGVTLNPPEHVLPDGSGICTPTTCEVYSFQKFEVFASVSPFIEVALELDFGLIKFKIAINTELHLIRVTWEYGMISSRERMDLGISEASSAVEHGFSGRCLSGKCTLKVTLEVGINAGLFEWTKEWSWSSDFARWAGLEIFSNLTRKVDGTVITP